MKSFLKRRLFVFIFLLLIFGTGIICTARPYSCSIMIDAFLFRVPSFLPCILHTMVILFIWILYYYHSVKDHHFKGYLFIVSRTPLRALLFLLMVLYLFLSNHQFIDVRLYRNPLGYYFFLSLAIILFYLLLFGINSRFRLSNLYRYYFHKIPDYIFDILAFTMGFVLLVSIKHLIFSDISIVSDTNSQIAHARILASGRWVLNNPLSGEEITYFTNGVVNRRMFSQYPPGYIIPLTIFLFFNKITWTGSFFGALTLPVLRRLGDRVLQKGAGRLAVLFTFFSPFWIIMSVEGMNHSLALMLNTVMLLFLIQYLQRKNWLYTLGAGSALGWLVITRPLNGLISGFVALIFILASKKIKQIFHGMVLFSIGVLPFLLFLGYFNHQTTGFFWTMGYIAQNPDIHQLGFIQSGPYQYSAFQAFSRIFANLFSLSHWLLPLYLGAFWFTGCWILKKHKNRYEYLLLVPVILQAGGYFLYHFHDLLIGPRFWYEMLSPIMVLLAGTWFSFFKECSSSKFSSCNSRAFPSIFLTLFVILTLAIGFFSFFPVHLQKFKPIINRGQGYRDSFIYFDPPSKSILFTPKYYHDWVWVFAPPINKLDTAEIVYARSPETGKYQELRDRLEDWTFYEFQPGRNEWKRISENADTR